MLKKKFVVMDDDEIVDNTLYDSIKEAQVVLESEDFAAGDSIVIYELVPKSEYVAPVKCSWKKVN
jgi:hypothetical protein